MYAIKLVAQRDSDLKVSTQICILMQNSRCVTLAALTGISPNACRSEVKYVFLTEKKYMISSSSSFFNKYIFRNIIIPKISADKPF